MSGSGAGHKPPIEIGWRERIGLPDLDIPEIAAKVDTGARTSALHATRLEPVEIDGAPWIRFVVPRKDLDRPVACLARLVDRRPVKNTSGTAETRYVIRTRIRIGKRSWHVEISLADRAEMEFELILGRTAIREHNFVVNPGRSWLAGHPRSRVRPVAAKKRAGAPQ